MPGPERALWTLTALTFPFRQLMAQEPLEKSFGFGDLIGGKSDKKQAVLGRKPASPARACYVSAVTQEGIVGCLRDAARDRLRRLSGGCALTLGTVRLHDSRKDFGSGLPFGLLFP